MGLYELSELGIEFKDDYPPGIGTEHQQVMVHLR